MIGVVQYAKSGPLLKFLVVNEMLLKHSPCPLPSINTDLSANWKSHEASEVKKRMSKQC